ncbi:MAG: T9SS type A sorting domain-containing protein, partial [Bacteroidales bacterium]|nr:T9SS type A sorting domain-containing protein [Bacteroidales bacterium]
NLSLHSIDGRLIWQKGGITDSTIQLNISDIQSGLYIFKLTSSFKTSLEKLIIK